MKQATHNPISAVADWSLPSGQAERPLPSVALGPVFVLVVWLTCLFVGLLGFVLPYARPAVKHVEEQPITAEKIELELTDKEILPDPLPSSNPPEVLVPAPPEAIVQPPQLPAPIPVAQPSPAVAFAIPVEGPVTVVEAPQAAYTRPAETTPQPAAERPVPQPQRLTFGQGEGKQPAPNYPPEAIRAGQEGTVGMRLVVGENGRVISAEVQKPCAWHLLNSAALKAVERRWRFRPGPMRVYEVPIRFQISK